MLGLQYHLATLIALILIVTFSAHIFTNAILKNMKKMKKMKIYISGKIGEEVISEATRQKFAKAQKELESKGHEVFNPTCAVWQSHLMHGFGADIQQTIAPPGGPISRYAYFLLRDMMALATKDAIYMLKDWTKSFGARAEREFALANGIEVIYEEEFFDIPMKLVLDEVIASAERIEAGKASLKMINCDGWDVVITAKKHKGA